MPSELREFDAVVWDADGEARFWQARHAWIDEHPEFDWLADLLARYPDQPWPAPGEPWPGS